MSEEVTHASTMRWALWAALLGSVAIHAALPFVLRLEPMLAGVGSLRNLLVAAGVAAAVAALAVHRLALRRPIALGTLDPADPAAAGRITALFIACWVLAELPVMFGLVLALLSGEPGAGAWGALLSLAAMALLAPRLPASSPGSAALARSDVKIG